MKYVKPTIEIFILESEDILSTSDTTEGSITADNITITGKKEEFFANFSDLLGIK
jgi:hypothetical protein